MLNLVIPVLRCWRFLKCFWYTIVAEVFQRSVCPDVVVYTVQNNHWISFAWRQGSQSLQAVFFKCFLKSGFFFCRNETTGVPSDVQSSHKSGRSSSKREKENSSHWGERRSQLQFVWASRERERPSCRERYIRIIITSVSSGRCYINQRRRFWKNPETVCFMFCLYSCEKERTERHQKLWLHSSELDGKVSQTVPHRLGAKEPSQKSPASFSQSSCWQILEMQVGICFNFPHI